MLSWRQTSYLLVRFAPVRMPLACAVQLREDRVDKAVSDPIEQQLRSVFPDGTFTQVDVLGYGDDPDVEPGETAIRAFVDRAGRPAETFGRIREDPAYAQILQKGQ